MVKNLKGGNKAKGQGRKYTSNYASRAALRLSVSDLEIYACVTKHFGQGRCLVKTVDDKELQCVIRHKFKKRNSNVLVGSIILVGLREWEGPDNYKICDLLELYDQEDHNTLKTIPTSYIHKLDKHIHHYTDKDKDEDNLFSFSENCEDMSENITNINIDIHDI
jgi:translation initiation factor IF-1